MKIDTLYGKGNFTKEDFNHLLETRIRFQPMKNKIIKTSSCAIPQDSDIQIYLGFNKLFPINIDHFMIHTDDFDELVIELDKFIGETEGYVFAHGGEDNEISYNFNIYRIFFHFGKTKIS